MKMLKLPGIKHTYFPVRKDYRYEIYYNCFTNNMLVFSATDQDMGVEIQSICNATKDKYYKHLSEELNENQGVLVYWTQGNFEQGEYTIYYDLDPKELLDEQYDGVVKILKESNRNPINSEYTCVINSEERVIG